MIRAALQCLAAMCIWLVFSMGISLLVAMLSSAALAGGLALGVGAMSLHLILWALQREPHWAYSGPIFGSAATVVFVLFMGKQARNESVIVFVFLAFTLVSYVIYPVARWVLRDSAPSHVNARSISR